MIKTIVYVDKSEIRLNSDGTVDEICIMEGEHCSYHLEQMDENHYWSALYDPDADPKLGNRLTVHFSARGKITAKYEIVGKDRYMDEMGKDIDHLIKNTETIGNAKVSLDENEDVLQIIILNKDGKFMFHLKRIRNNCFLCDIHGQDRFSLFDKVNVAFFARGKIVTRFATDE